MLRVILEMLLSPAGLGVGRLAVNNGSRYELAIWTVVLIVTLVIIGCFSVAALLAINPATLREITDDESYTS